MCFSLLCFLCSVLCVFVLGVSFRVYCYHGVYVFFVFLFFFICLFVSSYVIGVMDNAVIVWMCASVCFVLLVLFCVFVWGVFFIIIIIIVTRPLVGICVFVFLVCISM